LRASHVFSLCALLLSIVACASTEETTKPPAGQSPAATPPGTTLQVPPGPEGVVRVGLLLPLSGSAAALATDMLQAAQLALFDVPGDNVVELLPRDTGGTPEGALVAAQSAIDGGAQLLLGPLFASSTAEVADLARAYGVNVLSFSNDSTVIDAGVWVIGFRPEEQVARIVTYTVSRGLGRIGALVPDDAYGLKALDAFEQSVISSVGVATGPSAIYAADGSDPSSTVRSFADYDGRRVGLQQDAETTVPPPFEAVLLPDGGLRLRSVASLLAYYDVDPAAVRLLGTMRWQDDAGVINDPLMQGAWLAAPSPTAFRDFADRYASVFGREPHPLAALAFDATALAVVLSQPVPGSQGGPDFTSAALADPLGFTGATGLFRLRPDGLADHGLAVLEIGPEGVIVIDEAPREFASPLAMR
jgi:ABC-type branched-subunit amino acid transport system substrate-binding protein